ncbi:AMP-binding protein, partial [Halobacteriovorax sp. HFRX-2_2]
LYYSVIGPLVNGNALLFYEGGFSTESTVRVIQKYKVTNLAGSPTAFRLLIGNGDEVSKAIKGQLRVVSSAGEPLNPEVINWFKNKLDVVINDHYGQTETGMTVNNHHELEHEIKPGSMGYAMPGYKVVILDENGKVAPPNTPGVIAVDIANSPIMWFKGYLKAETPAIANGFYTTGDTAEQTEDGRITYVGRNDDVITSSGYRIGPFDVESVLLEHPCVLETAVIGKPDPKRTEIVKAFVVLNKGFEASEELKEELSLFVKKGLAAHAYPREIEFIEELPKTPSGKVQRFLLKRRED